MINSVDEHTRTKWLKSQQTSHSPYNRRDVRCSIQYNKAATVLIVPYKRINSCVIVQMNSTHKHFNAGNSVCKFRVVIFCSCALYIVQGTMSRNKAEYTTFPFGFHYSVELVSMNYTSAIGYGHGFYCAHFCLILSKYLLGFVTTSRYGNAFGISDPLWREFTGHRGD